MKKKFRKWISLIGVLWMVGGCAHAADKNENEVKKSSDYRVLLSLQGSEAVTASEGYDTVVIDPQYLQEEDIAAMQERGQKVYAYLNIGSLETFRPYYEDYRHLVLKPYRNWEDEYWVDVSQEEWQTFITETLTGQMLEKGIDGFWIDNVDVYGQFPNQKTYTGVEGILKELMSHGKPVVINGGNEFVQFYLKNNHHVDNILTGVNQESVFSSIDFDTQTLGRQTRETKAYYLEYLNAMEEQKKDIFLLEYTVNPRLIKKIQNYANGRGWEYDISDSIELDGDE